MARRAAWATAVAVAGVALANAWVGLRLPVLLQESPTIGELLEVERRAARFPRERVRLLVAGNSHALAGLRPEALAAALGLGPDGAFSLALPAASPHETRRLLERHLAAFPHARRVVVGVDEYFLGAEQALRSRYLTTGDLAERAAWAADQPLEARLRLLAGAWLPILDFGATLHGHFAGRTRHALRGLVRDVPSADPYQHRTAAIAYRWGFPPPWDQATARGMRLYALHHRSPDVVATRARFLLAGLDHVERGAGELGRLATILRARGVALTLVEMPYAPVLDAAIRRQAPDAPARWRAALDALPELPPRLAAPPLAAEAFYDADHLTPAGAAALARHVALSPPPGGRTGPQGQEGGAAGRVAR